MPRAARLAAPVSERRRGSSSAQLIDATAALLSERPALDVSLSEIAQRSGLNSALIKYYFGNKEGLLLAVLERDAKVAMDALNHLIGMDVSADQKLRIHISGIINTYYRSPYLNRLIYFIIESGEAASSQRVGEVFIAPMIAAYEAIVAQGVREGVFRAVDPALLYYSVVGSCEHIFHATYSVPQILHVAKLDAESKQRYISHVTEIVLKGLAP